MRGIGEALKLAVTLAFPAYMATLVAGLVT
jgi:hypothetical protein